MLWRLAKPRRSGSRAHTLGLFLLRGFFPSLTDVLLSLSSIRLCVQIWLDAVVKTPLRHGVINGIAFIDTKLEESSDERLPSSSPADAAKGNKQKTGVTVVLAHGFGLGQGVWSANIDAIAAAPGVARVVAFDWRGMGASDRGPLSEAPLRRWRHKEPTAPASASDAAAVAAVSSVVDAGAGSEPQALGGVSSVVATAGPTLQGLHRRLAAAATALRERAAASCSSSRAAAAAGAAPTGAGEAADGSDAAAARRSRSHSPSSAVSYFLSPLQSLFTELHLSDVVLVAHSLGGYLGTHLTAQLPGAVRSLVLASPAGVVDAVQDARLRNTLIKRTPLPLRLIDSLWQLNVTPQQLIRLAGERRGKAMATRLAARVFNPPLYPGPERELLVSYLYHMCSAPASGEYALSSLLHISASGADASQAADAASAAAAAAAAAGGGAGASRSGRAGSGRRGSRAGSGPSLRWGVFARESVASVLQGLPASIPVHFVYGDHDWLYMPEVPGLVRSLRNPAAAPASTSTLSSPSEAPATSPSKGGRDATLTILPGAGHHVYSDNPAAFHRAVAAAVARLSATSAELATPAAASPLPEPSGSGSLPAHPPSSSEPSLFTQRDQTELQAIADAMSEHKREMFEADARRAAAVIGSRGLGSDAQATSSSSTSTSSAHSAAADAPSQQLSKRQGKRAAALSGPGSAPHAGFATTAAAAAASWGPGSSSMSGLRASLLGRGEPVAALSLARHAGSVTGITAKRTVLPFPARVASETQNPGTPSTDAAPALFPTAETPRGTATGRTCRFARFFLGPGDAA